MEFFPPNDTNSQPHRQRPKFWVDNTEANFRPSAGTFQTGQDPAIFANMPTDIAGGTLQAPIGVPIADELDPIEANLRARNAQNRLALMESKENDPDYQFFDELAGKLGYAGVEQIATHIDTSTDIASVGGFSTFDVVGKAPAGGVPGPSLATMAYGVNPASVGTKWKLNANVATAYTSAVNELMRLTYNNLCNNMPSWIKSGHKTPRDAFSFWLRNSLEVRDTFCDLIASFYGISQVARPKTYLPSGTFGINKQLGANAVSKFQFQVRWASSLTESQMRNGSLVTKPLEVPSLHELMKG